MPKESKKNVYDGIPRFNRGQRIFAFGYGLGKDGYKSLTKCMSVEIQGASMIAASAVALGALTSALI